MGGVKTAVVLFNRDLRVHDNPALAAAAEADRTVPLFVLDEFLLGSRFAAPNRVAFMLEALHDLDASLRRAGGRLFVRRGDPVTEALAVARECGATELHVSADWSAYARGRERRLAAACRAERIEFRAHPGTTIAPPGAVTPAGGDHFKVFTPYHRAWSLLPPRRRLAAPRRLTVPSRLGTVRLPALEKLTGGAPLAAASARRRARGPEADARLRPRTAGGIRAPPRRPARRRHLAPQPPPALRLRLGAGADGGGRQPPRRRALRAAALLARLPPPGARRLPLAAPPRLPPAPRPLVALGARPRRLAPGADRLSRRRRGDAPAGRRGLHAQPRPDGRRLLPDQGPLHRLAAPAPGTSGTCSATARSPTTPATGSGSPGPATTPVPTGSSTRSARPNASTPTASTCGATYPSWSRCAARRSSGPG